MHITVEPQRRDDTESLAMARSLRSWSRFSRYFFVILIALSISIGIGMPEQGAVVAGVATVVSLAPSLCFLYLKSKYLKSADIARISFVSEKTGDLLDSIDVDLFHSQEAIGQLYRTMNKAESRDLLSTSGHHRRSSHLFAIRK